MITQKKKKTAAFFVNLLIFLIFVSAHSSGAFPLRLFSARAMLPLSMLVALSMFCSETTAAFSGLIIGIFTDSSASTPLGFNTIAFMLAGLLTAFISHYLFNKNIRSCVALGIICSVLYFFCKWIFTYLIGTSFNESVGYLLEIMLPSALLTTACVIPFYYLERYLFKLD